jgi:hypothetical protein
MKKVLRIAAREFAVHGVDEGVHHRGVRGAGVILALIPLMPILTDEAKAPEGDGHDRGHRPVGRGAAGR